MDFRGIIEFFKDISQYIILVVIVLLFFIYVCGFEQVVGPSMQSTLLENDIVIVNKLLYKIDDVNYNDIVSISQDEKHMIKRVIGLPGDIIKYENNYLYVNGVKQIEKFLDDDIITEDFSLDQLGYDKIPEDMYLVLGDNRVNSMDSRNFGLVKKENIIGKAWIRVWPFSKMGILK